MQQAIAEAVARKRSHSEDLNIRIDKTAPAGIKILKRLCNENCVFDKGHNVICHDDNSYRGEGTAITNEAFIESVKRIRSATGKNVVVHIAGDGEPTMFENELLELVKGLKSLHFVSAIKMTTNGTKLREGDIPLAKRLKEAGLDSVNVSLHSLNSEGFKQVTGTNHLGAVLAGIDAAINSGLRVTLNCLVREETLKELDEYIRFSAEKHIKVKFLFMIGGTDQAHSNGLIDRLRDTLKSRAQEFYNYRDEFYAEDILLVDGAMIEIKDPRVNNCPNLKCTVRDKCLETCRYFLRITPTGIAQPCGVRDDNLINMLSRDISDKEIAEAIKSGGKLWDDAP